MSLYSSFTRIRTSMSLLVSIILLAFFSTGLQARELDEIEVTKRKGGAAGIRIKLSSPVQAVRFSPKKSGRTLYISVRISGSKSGRRPRSERITSFDKLNGRLPLRGVTLELNGAEGDRLIVRFSRTTPYKLFQGRDGRSIYIFIPAKGMLKTKSRPAAKPKNIERPFSGSVSGKMARARKFLIQGNYKQAINLFSQIIRSPSSKDKRDARELLGLAYERDRKFSKARNQYRLYLKAYPKGSGADRVRQRLRNLTRVAKRRRLRGSRRGRRSSDILYYGTISQRLYSSVSSSSLGSSVDQRTLISNLNVNARKRTDRTDFKGVLSADYIYDFVNPVSKGKIQKAYIESKSKWRKVSAKLGRQSGRGGGVLGRFDGILAGGNVFPKWRLNAVGGSPVESFSQGGNKEFQGVSIDAGTFAGKWSGSFFKIDSKVDSFKDRQAMGAELRYFDKTTTAFGMVDYDTYFNDLNVAMTQVFWKAKDNWSYNVLVDFRKAPFLQLHNALLAPVNGTSYDTIAALAAGEPAMDLVQLAKNRTTTSRVISIGVTMPNLKQFGVKSKFLRKIQLGGDISYSGSTGLPASAGQPASAGTDTTTLTARAIATKLFFKNEVTVAGVSIINNTDYNGIAAYFTERNRIKRNWRLDAGLKWYQQSNSNGTGLVRLTPSVRVEYRRKKATFEFELGRETSQSINPLQNENIDRDFLTIGYRYDF